MHTLVRRQLTARHAGFPSPAASSTNPFAHCGPTAGAWHCTDSTHINPTVATARSLIVANSSSPQAVPIGDLFWT